jgi:hypothetical protein
MKFLIRWVLIFLFLSNFDQDSGVESPTVRFGGAVGEGGRWLMHLCMLYEHCEASVS